MSTIKLDLSSFKHVKSDKDSTTLRHGKLGHTVVLAHKSMSPDNKAMLLAMAEPKHYAFSDDIVKAGATPEDQKLVNTGGGETHTAPSGVDAPTMPSLSQAWQRVKTGLTSNKNYAKGGRVSIGDDYNHSGPGSEAMAAYDAGLPCLNPNCKSHGHPHPNCRCYSGGEQFSDHGSLAEGGEVKPRLRFCAHGKPHMAGCEYAKGGEVEYKRPELAQRGKQALEAKHTMTPEAKAHSEKTWSTAERELKNTGKGPMHEEYAKGGMAESNDALASGEGGTSEQGRDVRAAGRLRAPGRGQDERSAKVYDKVAKDEARGRHKLEQTIKPKMKGLAQGGRINMAEGETVPYGMDKSDKPSQSSIDKLIDMKHAESMAPKDEHETENELSQFDAQNPSALQQSNDARQQARQPASNGTPGMLQQRPGMPGYGEPANPINDTENPPTGEDEPEDGSQTNQALHDKFQSQGKPGNTNNQSQARPQEAPEPASTWAPPEAPDQSQIATHIPVNSFTPQNYPPEQYKEAARQSLQAEDLAYQHDLNNGHITPKTYGDLFESKDTLGKIGQIFGLMLGGVGGIKTGTNSALNMMDKIIANDLEAQKVSKTNAHNAMALNQQRLLQQAQINEAYTRGDLNESQAAIAMQNVKTHVDALTHMQLNRSMFHELAEKAASMPVGSKDWQNAHQTLGLIGQSLDAQNADIIDRAAAQSAMLNSEGLAASTPEEALKQRQRIAAISQNPQLLAKSKLETARSLPGIQGTATRDITDDDTKRLQKHEVLDNQVNGLINFAKKHSNLRDQKDFNVIKEGRQRAEELTSTYNGTQDGLGLTKGRLDWLGEQIKKNPQSPISQILGNNATLEEIRRSNQARKNLFLSGPGGLGFPPQSPKTSEIRQDAQGNKWMQGPNGVPVRVK